MKKILYFTAALILVILNSSVSGLAQNTQDVAPSKSQIRKEKRELTQKVSHVVDSLNFVRAKAAIDGKKWTFEIKNAYDKNGMPVQIDNPRNNISMRGETANVHFSTKFAAMDKKGNVTISAGGAVQNYSKTADKKGAINIRYLILSRGRNVEVMITLMGGGNQTNVEVDSPTTGERVRFTGNLVPIEKTKGSANKKGNSRR